MFKCTCGYKTCKESYETEIERTHHSAGVKMAKTKLRNGKSTGEKSDTNMLDIRTANDIRKICQIYAKLFNYRKKLEKKEPMAKLITKPRVASSISEQIILYLLDKGIILKELSKFSFSRHGKRDRADIIAKYGRSSKKIEVKSTGDKEFQEFGSKDMAADYLIWLNFGRAFIDNDFSKISIITIKKPNQHPKLLQYFKKHKGKITLRDLENILGQKLIKKIINFQKL